MNSTRKPRILVTGSRDWSDRDAIEGALYSAWEQLGGGASITLVHGHCPTGADRIAELVWSTHRPRNPIERHPADWSKGRGAGPERNREMVELGADVCLAFIGPCTSPRCDIPGKHDSHGATGCADLAGVAGIEVRRFRS